jgi:ABC-2 type transport system permease protein
VNALIRTELLKLAANRLVRGLLVAGALLAAARLAMVVRATGTAAGVDPHTTAATVTMLSGAGLGAIALLLVGATAVSGEVRHATLTATFLAVPHRRAVVIAKLVTYTGAGACFGLLLEALGLATSAATGLLGPLTASVWAGMAATVLASALLAALGVAVGLLIRNQTAALVTPLVWLVVVEPLTQSFGLRGLSPWLPGTLTGELGPARATGSLPPAVAATVLLSYVLILAVIGARRLVRADIG